MKLTPSSTARRSSRLPPSQSAIRPEIPRLSAESHRAVAETIDGQIAAEEESVAAESLMATEMTILPKCPAPSHVREGGGRLVEGEGTVDDRVDVVLGRGRR